ncbi:unnamed protein product (macronuclear) [Paramecium tetraurelia]|uniref:Transmembrane protein n=1 Tax=Paramecium tetraurelia TaxID=5888 RepID=A0BMD2_PARTE|nr:uncharacterized protein GSPATT00030335001 [Paramecium tetraurelia]CAK59699.1 unnamed protein product [Paramecium tetraurelia]|eukprot:XP_001427097.1 hypothetical protein (macronuclear) [Paramecium tetraurelia strain d4-2]
MIQKCKEGLRQIDIFGQTINLSFRQEEQYKTSIGGFLSICMIATIISFFYSNIINFFAKLNKFTFANDPDNLKLDKDHFMFAVQIEQDNFTTNPFFNITVEQRHYHRYPNGTQYRYPNIYIDLVPCTIDHFSYLFELYSVNFTDQFEQQNLKNFLCPNLNFIHSQNLTVGGVWASTDYYFLKFSVTNCINSSNNNFTWKPTCKTSDEIASTLNYQGSFRFQVFTTNFLINPNRPKDFVQPFLATDQFYTFVPDKMFVQSDIFFRTKKVTTDQGILMYPDKLYDAFAFRDYGDQREQFEISRITPNYYGAFYFQRSPYSYQINRKFLRLDELLSYLGGFTQFMMVVVGILVRFYNRQHLIVSIANDLYEYDMSLNRTTTQMNFNTLLEKKERRETQKQKTKSNHQALPKIEVMTTFQNKPDMLQNTTPAKDDSERFEQKHSLGYNQPAQTRLSILKVKAFEYFDDFREFIKKKYVIGLGFRVILSSIIPLESIKNNDCVVLQSAIDQVNKELDIEYIIKQLHELAKLKKVLFTEEQITLFNFSRKPKIALIQEGKKRRSTKYIANESVSAEEQGLLRQFNNLVTSYYKIMGEDYENQTQEQVRFNQRLIILLGSELMNVLEKEISQQQHLDSENNEVKEDENLISDKEVQNEKKD